MPPPPTVDVGSVLAARLWNHRWRTIRAAVTLDCPSGGSVSEPHLISCRDSGLPAAAPGSSDPGHKGWGGEGGCKQTGKNTGVRLPQPLPALTLGISGKCLPTPPLLLSEAADPLPVIQEKSPHEHHSDDADIRRHQRQGRERSLPSQADARAQEHRREEQRDIMQVGSPGQV